MANGKSETADELGSSTPLEERVSADKRHFLRMVLGSLTAYSVPLMASFSMGGLRIGTAEAQPFPPLRTPGFFITNQVRGAGDGPPPPAPPTTYRDSHGFDPPPPEQPPPVPPEVP